MVDIILIKLVNQIKFLHDATWLLELCSELAPMRSEVLNSIKNSYFNFEYFRCCNVFKMFNSNLFHSLP